MPDILDKYWLPNLESELLLLRPISKSDFENLYAVASDPELWLLHSEKNRYQREAFQMFFDKSAIPPAALVILDKGSGEVIGSTRYYDYDPSAGGSVVVGYTFLAKKYWGGLVNANLKRLMLDHAFKKVNVVIFHTSEGNLRSQRAIAKLGAVKSDGLIDLPGVGVRVEYRLTKEQWHARLQK